MTVDELVARFPEIPPDLHGEPVLAELASTCGDLLEVARKPSNCAREFDAANHYYLKLLGPMATYGYGILRREKLLQKMRDLLDRRRADPAGFAQSLLPADTAPAEVKGPGCS